MNAPVHFRALLCGGNRNATVEAFSLIYYFRKSTKLIAICVVQIFYMGLMVVSVGSWGEVSLLLHHGLKISKTDGTLF